jgi:hyperosmotically inducible periplasmic protein
MKTICRITLITLLLLSPTHSFTQNRTQTLTASRQALQAADRLERHVDSFSKSSDRALDRSKLNWTEREDRINALVDDFEFETDQFLKRLRDGDAFPADLDAILTRALKIHMLVQELPVPQNVSRDWTLIREDLQDLARLYNVTWTWKPTNRFPITNIARNIESSADSFQRTLDMSLDYSPLNGTKIEDEINGLVQDFEKEADQLRDRATNSGQADLVTSDVQAILARGQKIDDFMKRHDLGFRASQKWTLVKEHLRDLSAAYNMNVAFLDTTGTASSRQTGIRANVNPTAVSTSSRSHQWLVRQVRNELVTLPYYDVFDWLEYEVRPDGVVVLRGQVVAPPDTKSRAEARIKDIEGVSRVVNQIEVLPVSTSDQRLRMALYNTLFNQSSPLFRYSLQPVPSIHIIVQDGRATLKGIVASEADKQLAYTRARTVNGLFEVRNELRVENPENL